MGLGADLFGNHLVVVPNRVCYRFRTINPELYPIGPEAGDLSLLVIASSLLWTEILTRGSILHQLSSMAADHKGVTPADKRLTSSVVNVGIENLRQLYNEAALETNYRTGSDPVKSCYDYINFVHTTPDPFKPKPK